MMVERAKGAVRELGSDPDAGGKWSLSRVPLLVVIGWTLLYWIIVSLAILVPSLHPGWEASVAWSDVEGPLRYALELTPWLGAIFVGGKGMGKIKGAGK